MIKVFAIHPFPFLSLLWSSVCAWWDFINWNTIGDDLFADNVGYHSQSCVWNGNDFTSIIYVSWVQCYSICFCELLSMLLNFVALSMKIWKLGGHMNLGAHENAARGWGKSQLLKSYDGFQMPMHPQVFYSLANIETIMLFVFSIHQFPLVI